MKSKPDALTTEQYREIVKLLKAEGWALVNFGELPKDEILLVHNDGMVQRVRYEQRPEFLTDACKRH